jgi:methionine-rich copper-binding protein CopC
MPHDVSDRADAVARSAAVRLSAGLAALLLAVAPAAPATAHAALVSSSPPDGAVVETLPDAVELTFSEAVATPAYVVVTDPHGRTVSAGEAQVTDASVSQPTRQSDEQGEYSVDYRIVSADGHPVTGNLRFTVGSGAEPSTAGMRPRARGFWGEHWRRVRLAGAGLLAGAAVLRSGLRARR